MVQQICNDRGWQIDSGGIYVLPKRNGFIFCFKFFSFSICIFLDNVSAVSNSNLAKLVELVCFLER